MRYVWDVRAVVLALLYDSNRTALLSLLGHTNGILSFNLASQGTWVGGVTSNINTVVGFEDRLNYSANLNYIKPGTYINTLEFKPLGTGKYVRSAANYAKLVSATNLYSIVKLRSKFLLKLSNICVATVGVLSDKKLMRLSNRPRNAGFFRHLGFRPTVRGVAMNPVDHPHGGGQGKTSGGRASVTPWAEITKGRKTRRKINYGTFILKR